MTVYQFPRRYGPRQSARRLAKRPKAPVIRITRNVDTLFRLADSIDRAEPERAELMYQAVLWSHPGHAMAAVNLGNLRFRKGHTEEAKILYQHARSCDPTLPEAAYNLGYIALEEGELSDALNLLELAVKLDPMFSDAHYNLGMARRSAGDHQGAANCFRRYLSLAKGEGHQPWAVSARIALQELGR
jgi:tetratricopeptide (TPR) repeat protein